MADTRPLRAEQKLTDTEALMWAVERDPILRSSFLNVTFLDRPPDVDRFRRRMEHAVEVIARLRQRVTPVARGGPEWTDDPDFDIDYHVRHIAVPPPGTDRQLLDLAALQYQDAFDPVRPLWQLTVVEGLEGGRAALLAKMHHTITDGVGGVRMSAMFLDLERDPGDPDEAPLLTEEAPLPGPGLFDTLRKAVSDAVDTVKDPVGTAQSMLRQVLVTDRGHSPLWQGRRSMARHFSVLSVDLEDAKRATKRLGGTINDFYVTGVAGGAGAYHRSMGSPVDELRVAMPISTRTDRSAGGNAFAPSRVLVPAGIEDPVERFEVVHERLNEVKGERTLRMAESFAGIFSSLPSPLLLRLARQQVETVDFACSNVRGAPFDLFVAGAKVLANHPMGPTAGAAFNATLLSYLGSLDIGINADTAAVDDPDLLRECIHEALRELVAAGSG